LHSKKEHNDGWGKQYKSNQIKLVMNLPQDLSGLPLAMSIRDTCEEEQRRGNATSRQIDVKAPSPCRVLGQSTSNHGPKDNAQLSNALTDAYQSRSFVQRHASADDGESAIL
jgi:hypothetical protein